MVLFLDISLRKIFVNTTQIQPHVFLIKTDWNGEYRLTCIAHDCHLSGIIQSRKINHLNHTCAFYKKWSFFMKQYMGHTTLSLNEVYQIYLKKKTKKKQNSFCKKVIENPWKDNVVQIMFHILDLNLYKILSKKKVQMETYVFLWKLINVIYMDNLSQIILSVIEFFFSDFARYFGKCNAVWTRRTFDKIGQIFVKG